MHCKGKRECEDISTERVGIQGATVVLFTGNKILDEEVALQSEILCSTGWGR